MFYKRRYKYSAISPHPLRSGRKVATCEGQVISIRWLFHLAVVFVCQHSALAAPYDWISDRDQIVGIYTRFHARGNVGSTIDEYTGLLDPNAKFTTNLMVERESISLRNTMSYAGKFNSDVTEKVQIRELRDVITFGPQGHDRYVGNNISIYLSCYAPQRVCTYLTGSVRVENDRVENFSNSPGSWGLRILLRDDVPEKQLDAMLRALARLISIDHSDAELCKTYANICK